MRLLSIVSGIVVAISLAARGQAAPQSDDLQLIQGTWQVVSGVRGGQAVPDEAVATMTMTINDREILTKTPNGEVALSYTIDASKSPKTIDVDVNGEIGMGIYSLDGDTLKIVHGEIGTDRPTEFSSPEGSEINMLILKRIKPEGREAIEGLVAKIRRADYEGDRTALQKLHAELEPFASDEKLAAQVHYWLGFALWRRAVNGFNENVDQPEQEKDLNQAISDFEAAIAKQPDFVDAKIGALGCGGLLLYLRQSNPTGEGARDTYAGKVLIAKVTKWSNEAKTAEPDNPRLLWVSGPAVFVRGGGPDKAIEVYRKGLEKIREQSAPTDGLVPAWGEPELLMSLAWSYLNHTTPNIAAAEENAQAALKLVPHWHYVKDILLPQIEAAKK